jgi:hypothetical protein
MDTNEANDANIPEMVTVKDFRAASGLPRSNVYRLLKSVPHVKVGKRILIPRAAVVALLTPKSKGPDAA